MVPAQIRAEAERLLTATWGRPVRLTEAVALGGGSISAVARIETSEGRYVIKWLSGGPPDLVQREADGLRLLAASGSTLRFPRVFGVTGDEGGAPASGASPGDTDEPGGDPTLRPDPAVPPVLVLEDLGDGRPRRSHDADFGRGLAELHCATAERYGLDRDNYCGATPQPNGWHDDWIEFYREHRLYALLRRCDQRQRHAAEERRAAERLLERLPDLLASDPEPPALIHGDLWSGNAHTTADGAPALIDPAAYYAHREAEWGMMALFGGFSPAVREAYEGERPLSHGAKDRLPLYTLYHLLNHDALFGGHYRAEALRIIRRF